MLVVTASEALLISITFTHRCQHYSITVSDLKQFQTTNLVSSALSHLPLLSVIFVLFLDLEGSYNYEKTNDA
jgi:hypothetical protein